MGDLAERNKLLTMLMIAACYSGSSTFNRTKRSIFLLLLLSNDFRLMDFDVVPSWAPEPRPNERQVGGREVVFRIRGKMAAYCVDIRQWPMSLCVYLQMVNNSVDGWYLARIARTQQPNSLLTGFILSAVDEAIICHLSWSRLLAYESWAKNYSHLVDCNNAKHN